MVGSGAVSYTHLDVYKIQTKTMVMYVYEQAFNKNYYGSAAAGGIVLFAFMVVLTLIRFSIEKED